MVQYSAWNTFNIFLHMIVSLKANGNGLKMGRVLLGLSEVTAYGGTVPLEKHGEGLKLP